MENTVMSRPEKNLQKASEIVVLASAKAKPGKEADLERALLEVAVPTRAQQGCLQFELYRSAQDPATITAFERWSSEEDHELHMKGDHVKVLMTRFDGILAGPPEMVPLKPL